MTAASEAGADEAGHDEAAPDEAEPDEAEPDEAGCAALSDAHNEPPATLAEYCPVIIEVEF